jgi:hypothetical protein
MVRRLLVAAVVLVFAIPASAEDKFDAKKLKGGWVREVEGAKIIFKFADEKKMTVEITPPGADEPLTVLCEFSATKEGALSGEITKVEKGQGPKEGEKFSFKVEVGKEKLILSDFNSDSGGDEAKRLIEGEYKKKTD